MVVLLLGVAAFVPAWLTAAGINMFSFVAKNILAAGQAVTACGAGVRHSGTSRVQSAVKQEPRPVTAGIPVPQGRE